MRKIAILLVVVMVALAGCVSVQQVDQTAKIVRALNTTELLFGVGLTIAELRGADHDKVDQIRLQGTLAFTLARDAVTVRDATDLSEAITGLRKVADDAILLCESSGVSPGIIEDIRTNVDLVFTLLDGLKG